MKKITEITRKTAPEVRKALEDAMERLTKETGLTFTVEPRATIGDGRLNYKILVLGEGGKTTEQEDLEYMMKMRGFKHVNVSVGGEKHTLVGYRAKARKRPWILQSESGKRWIFTDEQVAHYQKVADMLAKEGQ